jgi:hypothetical protein
LEEKILLPDELVGMMAFWRRVRGLDGKFLGEVSARHMAFSNDETT